MDVPNIDGVLFADPRRSKVDIVQAVGRALRTTDDKEYGYILIPVISHGEPPNVFVESEAFQGVIDVIRALAANDERVIDYFHEKREGKEPSIKLFEVFADDQISELFEISKFEEHIGIKVWEKITPISRKYVPYDEAIKFVHALKLKGQRDWMKYARGEFPQLPPLPENIPGSSAFTIYAKEFAEKGGWPGWLGTDYNNKHSYLSYKEASAYVHTLKLKNTVAWWTYRKSGMLPKNIPGQPDRVYGQEYLENGKMPGWLGLERKPQAWKKRSKKSDKSKWRSYDEAVKFTRSLGLKNTNEWRDYCAGRMPWLPEKPADIPASRVEAYPEYYERGGDGAWVGSKIWRKKNPGAL